MHHPVTEEERPGLQALLRGARECETLLPPDSPRRRAAHDLADDLVSLLLKMHPEEPLGRDAEDVPQSRP